ncbi:MAG TPA: hypothetical protein VMW08_14120 [Acidimicrobiales bacterium]|nr:hypothetical protein [Acidimicrobiales bacterium]
MVALLDTDTPLKRKQKVVATTDLRGVPEGMRGKVLLVNGFDWIRYRVLFDNGVDIGTLDRKYVATDAEYADLVEKRASGFFDRVEADGEADGDGDEAATEDAGDGAVVNGVSIPARLLAMSAKRREVLGKPKS